MTHQWRSRWWVKWANLFFLYWRDRETHEQPSVVRNGAVRERGKSKANHQRLGMGGSENRRWWGAFFLDGNKSKAFYVTILLVFSLDQCFSFLASPGVPSREKSRKRFQELLVDLCMMVLFRHILRRRLRCALHCMPNQAHSNLCAVTYVNLLLYLRLLDMYGYHFIAAWQAVDKTVLEFLAMNFYISISKRVI